MDAGVAVYANHLPLDAHPTLGNNAQLAAALGLTVRGGFHQYQRTMVGTQGESDLLTSDLVARVAQFSAQHATAVIATPSEPLRRTRRWAICTGAGASSDTLREAAALGIDTLITGEGPHHTAVEAPELGLVVVYAGHYATETLGVRAIAALAGDTFGLPWSFIAAPTGT
jgi:putative NIF3 family GTP cyclohydrolase 1 type 2